MSTTEKTAGRGRPRAFDLDAAIDTAVHLFHARGYDAVGVAELVANLGIKPPSFYAAFHSKAGLYARALQRYGDGDNNIFGRARAAGGGIGTVITRTLALAAAQYPRRNGVAGCLVLDGACNTTDPEARALAIAARRAGRAAIRDFIAEQAPDRADALTDFVFVTMMGLSAAARDGADAAALAPVAAMAAQAFCRELGASGAPSPASQATGGL